MSNLVHIRSVAYIPAEALADLVVANQLFVRLPTDLSLNKINIEGLAGMTIEDQVENNQRFYTTTLTFRACEKKPADIRRSAFIVESVVGKRYLIGSDVRPWPIYKEVNRFPDKPTDSALKECTVTWRATWSPLEVID